MQAPEPPARPVRRRHVLFVPGYDPIPPRRYRELYRREGARQAAISGYQLAIAPLSGHANYQWQAEIADTTATIEFLTWEDIVRASMDRSILSSYLLLVRTVAIYIGSGAFFRLVRLRVQPMLAALYPVIVLLAQLELALLVLAGLWWGLVSVGAPHWLGAAVGALAGGLVLRAFHRWDRYIFAYYLINDYGFTAQHAGRIPAALQARVVAFASRIAEVARGPADEVLIIGHSSGAQVAVSALAHYLRQTPAPPTALAFLTIGQVIPMQSFLPRATGLRADLHHLSQCDAITWVDISAPGDGGCFALSDPVHVTGVAPPEAAKRWPKVISAAFAETMSRERLAETKWRFFRRHIQYLCAFERPRDYDYFQITAGPKSLAERFGWRGATASRIERPLSGYRDI